MPLTGYFSLPALLSVAYSVFILNLELVDQFLQMLLAVAFAVIIIGKFDYEILYKIISIAVLILFAKGLIIEWNVWLIK